jgi:hypothetical protein
MQRDGVAPIRTARPALGEQALVEAEAESRSSNIASGVGAPDLRAALAALRSAAPLIRLFGCASLINYRR